MLPGHSLNSDKWTFIEIISLILAVRASHLDTTFHKVHKPELMLQTSTTAANVPTVLDCAFECLARGCDSFLFKEPERLCKTGNCVVTSQSANSSKELYLSCNKQDGFQLLTSGLVTACVWIPVQPANYTDARENCKAKGAHLYTVKTLDKLRILQANYNFYLWVGMNDMAEEGTFRWEDDGSDCDAACMAQIFAPNQPDDQYDNEDCIYYYNTSPMIFDGLCTVALAYICEKPCFNFI